MKKKYRVVFGELAKGQCYYYINHHPVTSLPIYVGIGVYCRYRAESHRGNWRWDILLKDYASEDIETYVFPVETKIEALNWEKFLIHVFRQYGVDLYNLTSGGESCEHIPETIERCRLDAIRGHKERTPEEDKKRSEKIEKNLKIYRESLTPEDLEKESKKFQCVYDQLPLEKKEAMIQKTLLTKSKRPQEQKEMESRKRSESLKLAHAKRTPEEKAATAAKRSKAFKERSPELEARRGEKISATKRLNNKSMTQTERDTRADAVSAGMLALPKNERTQAALRAWETKRKNKLTP